MGALAQRDYPVETNRKACHREHHCCEEQSTDSTAVRWRCLKVHGPFPFNAIGVLSELTRVLAEAGISLLAVSTHDTDYLFVQVEDLADAVRALRRHRHTVHVP
jgi:hypothetical protein